MYSFLKDDGNGPIKSSTIHIKNLQHNDGIQWHDIFPAYSTQLLAPRATFTVFKSIPKQGPLIKTTLQNFGCSLPPTKMPLTCLAMTERMDTSYLMIGNNLLKLV